MRVWKSAEASLEVDGEEVTLVSSKGVQRSTAHALSRGDLDAAICAALDVETLAEARAILAPPRAEPTGGPCACAKNVDTAEEHGSIETLAWASDPNAPVEVRATVGRCTVCGRFWTFSEAGDSHYGFSRRARPFSPE